MSAVVETADKVAALKAKGNTSFALGTREGYTQAASEFSSAASLDPSNHVLLSNLAAAQLEIGRAEWDAAGKVTALAKALDAATRCCDLAPAWPKGWVRRAAAEFELVAARGEWEKRKVRDEERAEKSGQVRWRERERERSKHHDLCAVWRGALYRIARPFSGNSPPHTHTPSTALTLFRAGEDGLR
jgi:hypothetical protein